MGWIIGRGNSFIFRQGGGKQGQTYWTTHFTGVPINYDENEIVAICNFRDIIKVGTTYHLFEENTVGDVWVIKKRTSTNGLSFSAASAALLAVGGAGEFDAGGQADPTVIYDGPGDWKMWFDAFKTGVGWYQLGYATSVDGDTWLKVGPILTVGGVGAWDSTSVHHPVCIKNNGIYYLFYSGTKAGNPSGVVGHIGLATSSDGINFTKHTSNPLIQFGTTGEWDDNYIRPSKPVKIYNKWYMWYWGFDGTTHAMGLATAPELTGPWTKQGVKLQNPGDGPTGSSTILKEGTNSKDKIVELWYCNYPSAKTNFANIALPDAINTKIGQFTIVSGNLYSKSLSNEPEKLYFNTIEGNKKASSVEVDSEFDWAWVTGTLYVYAEEHPDVRYQIYYNRFIPNISTAVVEDATPTKVEITFDYALDESSVPDVSAFALAGKTISTVEIATTKVTLTVDSAYILSDSITCIYTKPASNPLKADTGDGEVASFSKAVSNRVVLSDAHTWGDYDFNDESALTKVGVYISQATDRSGSGNHLLQAGADGIKPTWDANGALFDGVGQFLKAATTNLDQPTFIYLVIKQVTWAVNKRIFDGHASNSGALLQSYVGDSPNIKIYAGAAGADNANLILDTWSIVRVLFSGAASRLQIDATAATVGNAGTANMDGFTLGANGLSNASYSNIQVKRVIIRNVDDNASGDEATIYARLKTKYEL